MKIRFMAQWVLLGFCAPHAFAGWTRVDEPNRIVPGVDTDGTANCKVAPAPTSIRNNAEGAGGHTHEYTVVCHGYADGKAKWHYVGDAENPSGWASVEAHAEVDGEFYVKETPMSLAHDTTVEVRCALLPNGHVKAEIADSRVFVDTTMSVTGTAMVVGSGGMASSTVFLSGNPQMFFYMKVEDAGQFATCVDNFAIQWHTEGDAYLWVDDGLFWPAQGKFAMHGDSTTGIVVGVCPTGGGPTKH